MKMNDYEFEDYLVRGWECGANIFYNGRIYFSQLAYNLEKDDFLFYAFSFKAEKYQETLFSPYKHREGGYVDEIDHIRKTFQTREEAKEFYFSSPIFEGKTFWEIGRDFEWLEYGGPDIIVD